MYIYGPIYIALYGLDGISDTIIYFTFAYFTGISVITGFGVGTDNSEGRKSLDAVAVLPMSVYVDEMKRVTSVVTPMAVVVTGINYIKL